MKEEKKHRAKQREEEAEKKLCEKSKKAHIAMNDSKRVFDLQWSVESCARGGGQWRKR